MLAHRDQWHPNYDDAIESRGQRMLSLKLTQDMVHGGHAHYAEHPQDFIEDWVKCVTRLRMGER